MNDSFTLHTLEVHVVGDPSTFVCSHVPGKNITVRGENLLFETDDHSFSMYALSALLPLLPAKQRILENADWMKTDAVIACPDPHCGARFEIHRLETESFYHDDVTKVPMPSGGE